MKIDVPETAGVEVHWESRNDFHSNTVDIIVTLAGIPIHAEEAEFEVGDPSWASRAADHAMTNLAWRLREALAPH
jgi:hypothetical protein